jgi:amino acid adenylation domain-containing protein
MSATRVAAKPAELRIPPGPAITIDDLPITVKDNEAAHSETSHYDANASEERRCLHELFSDMAKRIPASIAINAWDGVLTYDEVDKESSTVARYLKSIGIINRPETSVCLLFGKSCWMTVATIGVLKAGGTCVPLDLRDPIVRLRKIVQDVGATTVLCCPDYEDLAKKLGSAVTLVSSIPFYRAGNDDQPWHSNPSTAAFIMYTSGSTGVPKGIVQEHGGLCYAVTRLARELCHTSTSRVLQFAAYTFDVSIGDTFATFANGGCLMVPSEDTRINHLTDYIVRERITHACITPTIARQLDREKISTLEVLALGGEPLTKTDIQHWQARTTLINIYGVTEASIWCTSAAVAQHAGEPANIGSGFSCMSWVVDEDDHDILLKPGEEGELLLSGPAITRGYLNDSCKTMERFIKAPGWAVTTGYPTTTRFFKTGDLAHMTDDGTIVLLGRKDEQIKIHGHRVERGEIEYHMSQLLETPEIAVDQVIFCGEDSGHIDDSVLIGFIGVGYDFDDADQAGLHMASADLKTALINAIHTLRSRLFTILPSYMMPQVYLPIRALPETASGKTDRKSLRERASRLTRKQCLAFCDGDVSPNPAAHEGGETCPLSYTQTESVLRGLWIKVLKETPESKINGESNFFQLGGYSAAAMRLVSTANAKGLPLSIVDVFQTPTLAGMAATIDVKVDMLRLTEDLKNVDVNAPVDEIEDHAVPRISVEA